MFQLLLSPATTTPLANGPSWHHRLNVGSAVSGPHSFALTWPGAVVGSLALTSFGVEFRRCTVHRFSAGFRPQGPRRGCLSTTPRMLTPRVSSTGGAFTFTITQPLTFYVVARTPSAEPQAPATGCSNPGTYPATFVNETPSGTALTRTIRTPLVPNGLRTTLLTVQNAFRRTQSSQRFSSRVDASHSVVHSK
jgi:hypothetical protein